MESLAEGVVIGSAITHQIDSAGLCSTIFFFFFFFFFFETNFQNNLEKNGIPKKLQDFVENVTGKNEQKEISKF